MSELIGYSFVDTETTGLQPAFNQIIEITVINTDFDFNETGRFTTKVQLVEGFVLSPTITELTGIKAEDLKAGMDEEYAVLVAETFFEDRIIVAQSATFDFAFLVSGISLSEEVLYENFICTRTLNKLNFPSENPSLEPTCKRLGIKHDNVHSSLGDTLALIDLLKYYETNHLDIPKNHMMKFESRDLMYIPEGATIIDERGNAL